jgi:transposase
MKCWNARSSTAFANSLPAVLSREKLGRPSLPPGMYFRLMMIGFFEGIDSERGIAWQVADSLTLRQFFGDRTG